MTPSRSTLLARALALGAGSVDVVAGGAMMVVPAWAFALMGLTIPAGDGLVYVRFLGVMVAAVGAVYLVGLLPGGFGRLRHMLTVTIVFRLAAGGFALGALALGWLEWPWVAVPVVDFGLVAAQGVLLAKGAGLDE